MASIFRGCCEQAEEWGQRNRQEGSGPEAFLCPHSFVCLIHRPFPLVLASPGWDFGFLSDFGLCSGRASQPEEIQERTLPPLDAVWWMQGGICGR
jgi:hypothetical protein